MEKKPRYYTYFSIEFGKNYYKTNSTVEGGGNNNRPKQTSSTIFHNFQTKRKYMMMK